jgi:hypothetical protein
MGRMQLSQFNRFRDINYHDQAQSQPHPTVFSPTDPSTLSYIHMAGDGLNAVEHEDIFKYLFEANRTHLVKPVLRATGGIMSFPESSLTLLISKSVKIVATAIHTLLSAK